MHLPINCIFARLPPQMLSLSDEYTFHFPNFLIIGLCNSSAHSLFGIILLLIVYLSRVSKVSDQACATAPLADFLSKSL